MRIEYSLLVLDDDASLGCPEYLPSMGNGRMQRFGGRREDLCLSVKRNYVYLNVCI